MSWGVGGGGSELKRVSNRRAYSQVSEWLDERVNKGVIITV